MSRVVALVCFSNLLGVIFGEAVSQSEKPNIIIIVADDLGFNDVGFHGGDIRTPNIDALAGHGVILQRHYALPVCSPSRAALMTGKYPIRTGMQRGYPIQCGANDGLPLNEKIFPEFFKKLGYQTHIIGKWHLGYETWRHMPTNRGFDTFYGFLNGFLGYYDGIHSHGGHSGLDFRRDETPVLDEIYGHYLTDLLTKEAISLIERHDPEERFLMVLNHAAPHRGNMDMVRDAPPDTRNYTERAILADMIRWLDDSVGQVLFSLNKKGCLNNSIIVFMADNGAPTLDPYMYYHNHGSNWPLRGLKQSLHDGGVRTVAFAWSPKFRPRISTDLFHITDWLPTLYAAAGGESKDLGSIDGLSHWHSLVTNSPGSRIDALVNTDPHWNIEALIRGKWKIIKHHSPTSVMAPSDKYLGVSGRDAPYNPLDVEKSVVGKILGKPLVPYDQIRLQAALNDTCDDKVSAESTDCRNKFCLYDILADSSECHDLSSQYPQVVAELESSLKVYRREAVPPPRSVFEMRAHPIYWNGFWSPWMDSSVAGIKSGQLFIFVFTIRLLQYFQHLVY